jgi:hypothetical protein
MRPPLERPAVHIWVTVMLDLARHGLVVLADYSACAARLS